MWEVNNSLYFVDPEFNLGLGYRYKMASGYSNDLAGIDLKNGRICWTRVINREYTWNDFFYTSDTTVLIVAAGLHSLKLKNGKVGLMIPKRAKRNIKKLLAPMRSVSPSGCLPEPL